jgi:hypothetical protein
MESCDEDEDENDRGELPQFIYFYELAGARSITITQSQLLSCVSNNSYSFKNCLIARRKLLSFLSIETKSQSDMISIRSFRVSRDLHRRIASVYASLADSSLPGDLYKY